MLGLVIWQLINISLIASIFNSKFLYWSKEKFKLYLPASEWSSEKNIIEQ